MLTFYLATGLVGEGGDPAPPPPPPPETDIERLTRFLREAREAMHSLAMGTQVVDLWHDGRRRRYAQQDMESVRSYIAWLECELAAANAAACGRPRRRAIALGWRN